MADSEKANIPPLDGEAELMSDELIEKLKLLDYESNFVRIKGHHALSRTFFITKSQNSGEQNVYFIALASWLLSQCGGKLSGDKKYDDPVTMANNLLTEMKNLGINCEVPPNQLRAGYGVPICTVLLSLADAALSKRGFAFKKAHLEESGKGSGGDVPDIEDEAPDLINNEIDYGDNINNEADNERDDIGKRENNEEDNGANILYSGTSPEDWQRELEKVSNLLKVDYETSNTFGMSEWRVHVNSIKKSEEKFTKEIPDSRAVLENLSGEIDKSLEKITKKEEVLSKNHANIISSYKERNKASSNQLDEYKQLNENVEMLKAEIDELTEKTTSANEKYEKLSNQVSDTSALGNMKQAITNLQNENLTMDMKINILNQSLLRYLHDNDEYKQSATEAMGDTSMYEEVL